MLDPQRVGLNAASVGFLTRTGQKVDWASFNKALQTDDSGVCNVTAEMRTPVDELHVMGGQRYGLEGNINLKTQERQERQMRGYPLRSFSANNPIIVLPDKFGGLPLYTRNQTEYADFCSSFTAPMSLPLQNDTVLLGREGYSVSNDSASKPFEELGFDLNMHKSSAAIDYNTAILQQRKYIMGKRSRQGLEVGQVTGGSKSEPSTIRGSGLAIGVGARGRPEFGENADAQALLQKSFNNEGLFGDMAEETAFEMSKQQQMFARQVAIGKQGVLENEVPKRAQEAIAQQVIVANPYQPAIGHLKGVRGGSFSAAEHGAYRRRKQERKDLREQRIAYQGGKRAAARGGLVRPTYLLDRVLSPAPKAPPRGIEGAATAATTGRRNAINLSYDLPRYDNEEINQMTKTPQRVTGVEVGQAQSLFGNFSPGQYVARAATAAASTISNVYQYAAGPMVEKRKEFVHTYPK